MLELIFLLFRYREQGHYEGISQVGSEVLILEAVYDRRHTCSRIVVVVEVTSSYHETRAHCWGVSETEEVEVVEVERLLSLPKMLV